MHPGYYPGFLTSYPRCIQGNTLDASGVVAHKSLITLDVSLVILGCIQGNYPRFLTRMAPHNYHSKHVLRHMLFYIYIQNLLMYLKFLKFITVLKLVILRQTKLTVHIAHRGYFSSMVIDIMISFIIKITSTILINSINLYYVVLISLHLAYTYLMQVLLRPNVLI